MKFRILVLSFLVVVSIVLSGCHKVAYESHETTIIETIESQEIVVE